MAEEDEKQAYKPQRVWKPRYRERDSRKRMKRKQQNLRNRSKRRMQQRQRYRKNRRNPTYRRQRRIQRQQVQKRRLRRSASIVASAWIVARDYQRSDTLYRDPRITLRSLEDLRLEVTPDLFDRQMTAMARSVGATYDPSTCDIHLPPSGEALYDRIRVLFRIFPDSTVSFDVLPSDRGRLLPRSKAARSFRGPLSQTNDLYRGFLKWLRKVLDAVSVFQSRRMNRNGSDSDPRS